MPEIQNIVNDDLKATTWLGFVEDNEDPKLEGRCRVRVLGKFDDKIDPEDPKSDFIIPTEHLPWARQSTNVTGGSSSGGGLLSFPKKGALVSIRFNEGNIYMPEYFYNVHTSDEVKTEIQNSYQNSHVLVYDTAFQLNEEGENERAGEHIKVFFTEEKGLVFDYGTEEGSSIINIRPDSSIFIQRAEGKAIHIKEDTISIGKEDESDEPAVLGEKNLEALQSLADRIQDLSTALTTFATTQTAVVAAVFPLAPLAGALTALNTEILKTQAQLSSVTRPKFGPTRSSSVTVDGPPKS